MRRQRNASYVKAIEASGNAMPRVMNVDKNPAYPAAIEALKAEGALRVGFACANAST
jgi:transposase-like protein